jgi:hypothetical protein
MAERTAFTSPLREATRKERLLLLAISVTLLVVVQGGLRPTKIAALGIDFAPNNLGTLVKILFAVHAFVLLAFVLAARVDKRAWELELSTTRNVLLKQTDACRLQFLKVLEADVYGPDLDAALDSLMSIFCEVLPHLRSRTTVAFGLAVAQLEIARNAYRAGGETWNDVPFSSYQIYASDADTALSEAQAGVFRALVQRDIHDKYLPLLHRRDVRGAISRRLSHHFVTNTLFRLRYTSMSASYLWRTLRALDRLSILAGCRDSAFVQLTQTKLSRIANMLPERHEISETAKQYTVIVLARHLGGLASACHQLIGQTLIIDDDTTRSFGRFSHLAFWEVAVPVWIGVLTLAAAIVTAALDGMLNA